jgi:hypothetical protein
LKQGIEPDLDGEVVFMDGKKRATQRRYGRESRRVNLFGNKGLATEVVANFVLSLAEAKPVDYDLRIDGPKITDFPPYASCLQHTPNGSGQCQYTDQQGNKLPRWTIASNQLIAYLAQQPDLLAAFKLLTEARQRFRLLLELLREAGSPLREAFS